MRSRSSSYTVLKSARYRASSVFRILAYSRIFDRRSGWSSLVIALVSRVMNSWSIVGAVSYVETAAVSIQRESMSRFDIYVYI
jgi:hypothetical protein